MTKEQLAASLDGCQYRDEVNKEWAKIAEEAGLIVVFGASDDLMEVRGAVDDELNAWDGVEAVFYKHNTGFSVIENNSETIREIEDDFHLYKALGAMLDRHNLVRITPAKDCQWDVITTLPHAKFDVKEEEDLYCRAVVIDIKDLK
ncbi:hypothetical protein [Hymenobacter metallicola]|uniref:Uncharacterized protein n=1 Tax=Hymenobacter metallicola TaxID=2563114 RepID=A0A4Z0QJ18_9BACT|nr:hypothetical protein [Hymenobacter metallicola]TGE29774.1 hypothetical protein E5K02_10030 [Hymenobacter metallicola]